VNASTQAHRERAWVEVDLTKLVHNARTALAAARGARLLPMVKAGAYGLGAVPVARALEAVEPWGYGVATAPEGVELREAGIRRPVVVFTPALEESQPTYRRNDLRAVLDDPAVIAGWELPFHLEIDTGMGRAGIKWDEPERLAAAAASPRLEGVFTHLHSADSDPASVRAQWDLFEAALRCLGRRPPLVHAANSAGIWLLGKGLDLVRPGVFLYGGRAGEGEGLPPPVPVLAVRARVVSLRTLAAGESVSYGAVWRAAAPTRIATLGVGYADGVPRSAMGRAQVLIAGRRAPVVGRITMDMLMVELPPPLDETVRVGDVATLIGADGWEAITVDECAGWAGTTSYEILTGLSPRLPREYR
jgi:alanine racemase